MCVSLRYRGAELLTLHGQVNLLGLTLARRVVGLAHVEACLLPGDVADGEPLLPADDLPRAFSVPHDGRGGVGGRHTRDGHLVTF